MEPAVRAALELLVAAPESAFAVAPSSGDAFARLAQRVLERVAALRADAVAEVDALGEWRATGAASVQAWARDGLGLSGGEAGTLVRTARALRVDLPLTRHSLWSGQLSWGHAVLLARKGLASAARRSAVAAPGGEATLVEVAAGVPLADLGRMLGMWAHGVDAAGVIADETEAFAQRRVTLAETFGGMWHLEGLLDPVGGAALASALEAVVRSSMGAQGEERTVTQLRADALVDLARRALQSGELPAFGGWRPQLLVHVPVATLAGSAGSPGAELSPGHAALSGLVTRLLGCDSEITPVAWTSEGRLLDLGRTTRTVPGWLRRAVVARDRRCVFPGCAREPAWCEAHHIVWWGRGGPTSLDNLCLLCPYHHGLVHRYDLAIAVAPDRAGWEFRHPDGSVVGGPPSGWPLPRLPAVA